MSEKVHNSPLSLRVGCSYKSECDGVGESLGNVRDGTVIGLSLNGVI